MALVKAKFVVDTESGKTEIPVHFNPSEYSISLSESSSNETTNNTQGVADTSVVKSYVESLTLTLYYDTFTDYTESLLDAASSDKIDVRAYTEEIVALARPKDNKKQILSFVWGSLNFTGYINNISQKFTMFLDDGKPVRAVLNVSITSFPGTSSTSGKLQKGKLKGIDLTDTDWKKNVRNTALVASQAHLAEVVITGCIRRFLG